MGKPKGGVSSDHSELTSTLRHELRRLAWRLRQVTALAANIPFIVTSVRLKMTARTPRLASGAWSSFAERHDAQRTETERKSRCSTPPRTIGG
jgi:hypothetical protein